MKFILGKKLGMTRHFDQEGDSVPVTVIEAGPCTVVQLKKPEQDGYSAVQLGYIEKKEKNVTKPVLGHFKKHGCEPTRILKEFRTGETELKEGDQIKADTFAAGDVINVRGVTKGRGFAGVKKRYNFAGGQRTHGQSHTLRTPGAVGQSATPKRIFKGKRMPGRMGTDRKTIQNLQVVKVIPERDIILVKGSVPGARNGIVEITG